MGVLRNFLGNKKASGLRFGTTLAIGALIASGLVLAPAAASADTAPVEPNVPSTVTTDALPTVQVNGIVWDQVIVGNTVYAAGQFSTARPAGAAAGVNEVARNNVIAYDIRTGAMTSFAPNVNGQVRSIAASPDGTRLYIGGDFTAVNGSTRNRVAAFNIPAGTLVGSWAPSVNASVRGITATNSAVYFTGIFGRVASNDRVRAAAVSSAGALLPWAPQLDNRGNDVVVSGDGTKVALAGHFTTVNGSSNPGYGMALVDATTGGLLPFAANGIVRNGGADAAIWSLSTDGDNLYGTGYHFGAGGNLEGIFKSDWATGGLTWVEDCHGDTYSAYATPDVVYGAGHSHYCGSLVDGFPQSEPWTFYRGVAFSNSVERTTPYGLGYGYYDWGGNPAPRLLHWYPTFNTGSVSGANQGPWNVTGNTDYVVMAGEFTRVNNQLQQGLVRFATTEKAPNDDGPRLSSSTWVPSANSIAEGTMRISWPLNWDRDNEFLEYKLIRDGANASPIYTTTARSKSADWGLPGLSFIDKGLVQGSTHTYRVRAEDAHGNVAWSNIITATVNGVGAMPAYSTTVLDDAPTNYWPLNDSGASSIDWAGPSDLAVRDGVTRSVDGALTPASVPASSFNGTNSGFATTQTAVEGPQKFAIEAWFKTTTNQGGKIVGFGNSPTGTSSSYDRHVYMDPSGRVNFGVYPNAERVVSSSSAYNDGTWHHVVASLDSTKGMELYIDGVKVAQRSDTTSAQSYTGYWRIGGDSTWSGSQFFNGTIDEVAIYGGALSRTQVQAHYVASGRTLEGATPPSDGYGAAVYAAEPTLYWRLDETSGTVAADASGSSQRGSYFGAHTKVAAGALDGVTSGSTTFEGGQLISQKSFVNPVVYSTEAWFKTTTSSGGKIIGFGNSATGNSSSYDRHVYMTDAGRLVFGAYTGQTVTVTSDDSYNNGQWHHVVATQGPAGMRLYVDGALVGQNPNTSAQSYSGYWHVGGDVTWGPGGNEFAGTIDEVAVYSSVLSPAAVADHYSLGSEGAPANKLPSADFTSQVSKLKVDVDGSASTDEDGTIASYDWNWGDDSAHGVGATATHTYAEAGTYEVTLTVTDDRAGTAQKTASVVTVANVPPTAAFTSSVTPLKVAVDAATSVDPDGTIASYDWNWGDDTAHGSGATANHTYAEAGTYTVTLTLTDNDGATTTKTESVVVPPIPANVAPTAAFTSTANGLGVSVDGSGSADADGTIVSHDWNWGDDTAAGSGATASHTYAEAGTYTVTLVVTDDDGATGTVSHDVTVEAPAGPSVLATDSFERTAASGLGTSDLGGAWSLANSASYFAVDGTGVFRLTSGGSLRTAYLPGVSSASTEVTVDMTFATVPVGGSVQSQALARRIGAADYRARVTVAANGSVSLQVLRSGTTLATQNLTGLTVTPGTTLTLRVEASGTNPTTIRAKAWKAGTAEPAGWQVSTTDATAALQAAGQVGLAAYAGSGVSNVPYLVRFDNLVAKTPGTVVPAPNVNPVASFTSSADALALSVDGSGSTDSDGSVTSWEWDFGDGEVGTGATAAHTYAAAGTYTVALKVTDDRGGVHTVTNSVTVTAPQPPDPTQPLVLDEFDRTGANGWGSAATGGAWSYSTTSVSAYSVDGAAAKIAVGAGSTRAAYLTTVSTAAADLTSTMTVSQLPVGGSVFTSFIARRVGGEDYRARAVVAANGSVQLQVQRTATTLTAANIAGLTVAAGEELRVRVQAFGTNPTTIRAKVWKTGTTEPAAWQVSTTDTTAALQAPGHVGVATYLGSGTTNVPYTVSFGTIKVVPVP
ncbi:PKD domain-containing protein [Microbacterium sp. APC 3901]|uniref:PKD domain-containing protein n=1 Tax=Microbacterium sp. APC 3901 TaxID=3035192 RepID=UPI0025B4A5E2|nr:PKD domain-containing protein [Microbacterium sp. APC 3901]MDN3444169.1 PKD domain-containing protein [Microbacterium sp. APC 3901]